LWEVFSIAVGFIAFGQGNFDMRIKILSLLFAALALAACETSMGDKGSAAGGGAADKSAMDVKPASESQMTMREMSGKPKAGTQEDLVLAVGDRVFFDFDMYGLRNDARGVLEKQAAWMERNSGVTATIEGHTDERGTRDYNLALGERRATSVRDYLVALGINANRLKTLSYGKERPVNPGSTKDDWNKNRRGVMVID
jgi:peptidoglycan-associated lipoprotein